MALFASFLATRVFAGTNRWTNAGPPGDWITSIAVVSSDPSIVYVTTLDGGVLKSVDFGENWSWTTLTGFEFFDTLVDPNDPESVLIATNNGLWKTVDGGASWVQDKSANLYARSLARDPSDSAVLFAGGTQGTFRSVDGGRTWRAVSQFFFPRLAIDGASRAVYGFGYGGLFRSTDSGRTWSSLAQEAIKGEVSGVAIDDSDPPTIYAASSGQIARSSDGGDHWEVSLTLSAGGISAIAVDPSRPGVAYASTPNGIFKTIDRGQSWTATGSEVAGKRITSLFVTPSGSAVYAGTWHAGIFRTRNSGLSWEEVNAGFGASRIWALAIDPANPHVAFAGGTDGLFRTEDGGTSWSFSGTGLEETGAIESLAIDANPATVYAVGQFVCPSAFPCDPGAAVFRSVDRGRTWKKTPLGGHARLLVDSRNPGVVYAGSAYEIYKSADSASTWIRLSSLPSYVQDLFADSLDPSVIWAATYSGAYVSGDGGLTWVLFGFRGEAIQSVVVDPSDRLRVYVVKYPSSTSADRVLRTSDGGRTWRSVNAGLPALLVSSLTLDPTIPSTLYAAVSFPSSQSLPQSQPEVAGVFRSIDGGDHWQPFNYGIVHPYASSVAIDRSGRFLYAVLYGGGVYAYQISASGPGLFIDPPKAVLAAGSCREFTLTIQPPRGNAVTASVTSSDTNLVSVPQSLTLSSSGKFSACGIRASAQQVSLTATLADLPETSKAEITMTNPAPRILKILPTAVSAGTPGLVLQVFDRDSSQGPVEGAIILWRGSPRPTARREGSPSWLETNISAEDLATSGSASVAVVYPAPGGGVSTPRVFVIDDTNLRSVCGGCAARSAGTRITEPRR